MLWAWIAWVECIGASTRSIYQWNQVISLLDMTPSQLLRMFFGYIGLYDSSNPLRATLFQDARRVSTCNFSSNKNLHFLRECGYHRENGGTILHQNFYHEAFHVMFWLEARNRCVSWQRTLFVCYDRSGRSGWALGGDPLWGKWDVPLLRKISWQDVPSKFFCLKAGIYYWTEIRVEHQWK